MISFPELIALLQILMIDITLAGDNAIAVGMAAAGLSAVKRRQAMMAGMAVATALRVVFAVFSIEILHVTGLLTAGGLILLWVGWKMYEELRRFRPSPFEPLPSLGWARLNQPEAIHKKLSSAILQIVVADVSMSLDNVLAVAGAARGKLWILVVGLTLSIAMMGMAATSIARLVRRYHWISWLGLATVVYTALHMIWDGRHDFF